MPREFFDAVTRPIGTRKWYTVPLSLLSHAAVIALLMLIPLMAPVALPALGGGAIADYVLVAATPPAPPPPAMPRDAPLVESNPLAAPTEAPSHIVKEPAIEPGFEARHGVDGGVGVVAGGFDRGVPEAPAPSAPAPKEPVRVGGQIRAPQKIHDAPPVYPAIAQAARVQGLVILEATIAANGRVVDARVLRSIPLLDQAALDAVRQWQFTPTLLNGSPVPVVMTVTVSFVLR